MTGLRKKLSFWKDKDKTPSRSRAGPSSLGSFAEEPETPTVPVQYQQPYQPPQAYQQPYQPAYSAPAQSTPKPPPALRQPGQLRKIIQRPLDPSQRLTPEDIRKLREMIRQRYRLDTEIWKHRNVKEFKRARLLENMKKSDAVMVDIQKLLVSWDRREYFETDDEYQKFCDIKVRLAANNKIVWADNPPWNIREAAADPIPQPWELENRPSAGSNRRAPASQSPQHPVEVTRRISGAHHLPPNVPTRGLNDTYSQPSGGVVARPLQHGYSSSASNPPAARHVVPDGFTPSPSNSYRSGSNSNYQSSVESQRRQSIGYSQPTAEAQRPPSVMTAHGHRGPPAPYGQQPQEGYRAASGGLPQPTVDTRRRSPSTSNQPSPESRRIYGSPYAQAPTLGQPNQSTYNQYPDVSQLSLPMTGGFGQSPNDGQHSPIGGYPQVVNEHQRSLSGGYPPPRPYIQQQQQPVEIQPASPIGYPAQLTESNHSHSESFSQRAAAAATADRHSPPNGSYPPPPSSSTARVSYAAYNQSTPSHNPPVTSTYQPPVSTHPPPSPQAYPPSPPENKSPADTPRRAPPPPPQASSTSTSAPAPADAPTHPSPPRSAPPPPPNSPPRRAPPTTPTTTTNPPPPSASFDSSAPPVLPAAVPHSHSQPQLATSSTALQATYPGFQVQGDYPPPPRQTEVQRSVSDTYPGVPGGGVQGEMPRWG